MSSARGRSAYWPDKPPHPHNDNVAHPFQIAELQTLNLTHRIAANHAALDQAGDDPVQRVAWQTPLGAEIGLGQAGRFLANGLKHIRGLFEGTSAVRGRSYHQFPLVGTNRSAQNKRRFPQAN
jgi:hypothetical protein